jgi:hypothetical protein
VEPKEELQLRTSDGIEGIGYSGFVSLLMLKVASD